MIVACAVLAASSLSCSGKAAGQPAEPGPMQSQGAGFSIPETGCLVLMLGSDGQLERFSGMADGQGTEPMPFALQTAISAVQAPVDGGAIVAVNRTGLLFLAIRDRQVMLRRVPGADAEFVGRSVAQAWTWDGKAMFLLHRNEIFETLAPRNPAGRVLAVTSTKALTLPAFGVEADAVVQEDTELYGSPYALFPRSPGRWLVQFRYADQDRTRTAFAAWNPVNNLLDPLDRSVYETIVRPAPASEAPPGVQLAVDALGGSLILDAVLPDGSHQSWLYGSAETALSARTQIAATSVVVLASDGRIVMVDADGTTYKASISPPVPTAYFRDLVMLDGFFIAVWEEDLFPDLGRSGLAIMDASIFRDGSGLPDGN